jgi:hypothetical protein
MTPGLGAAPSRVPDLEIVAHVLLAWRLEIDVDYNRWPSRAHKENTLVRRGVVMNATLDIVLLLALPASGKSEVRKYLATLGSEEARRDFHLGPTVQLDDYPYVHLMRRVSEELRRGGHDGVFFASSDEPMLEPRDWGTLIELLNEDYRDLRARPARPPAAAGEWLLDRFDTARAKVGARPAFGELGSRLRGAVADAIEAESRQLWDDKIAGIPSDLRGKTLVMEFARGGPDGAKPPLPEPLGYQYSLARLSDDILERAAILYVWVTPEESRRKNEERARPGREGDASILHHGVPLAVMLGDYGVDDMAYLIESSDKPGTVRIETRGRTFHLPVARFDNRVDKTSFVREDRSKWAAPDVRALHEGLKQAFEQLARA